MLKSNFILNITHLDGLSGDSNYYCELDNLEHLKKVLGVSLPIDYVNLMRDTKTLEVSLSQELENEIVFVFSFAYAREIIEIYDAFRNQKNLIVVGQHESGYYIIYALGENGWGYYAVSVEDVDIEEYIYLGASLEIIFNNEKDIRVLIAL